MRLTAIFPLEISIKFSWKIQYLKHFSKTTVFIVNCFESFCRVYFEIMPDGHIHSDVSIQVAKIFHRWNIEDCVTLGLFFASGAISIYFILIVLREICFLGCIRTFKQFSTFLFLGMSVVNYFMISLH